MNYSPIIIPGQNDFDYILDDDVRITEPQAVFTSGRLKRQILGNSSVGLLYVGKHTAYNTFGVIDKLKVPMIGYLFLFLPMGFMMDISLLGRKDVSTRNDITGANRGPE